MLYHTHRLLLLCATTTSLPGTHCTYWQKLSRLLRCCVARLNRCSWWALSRNSRWLPLLFSSCSSQQASH